MSGVPSDDNSSDTHSEVHEPEGRGVPTAGAPALPAAVSSHPPPRGLRATPFSGALLLLLRSGT